MSDKLAGLKAILPTDTSDGARRRYAETTLVSGTTPLAIAYPTTVDEIAAIVKWAREAKQPLYPISRGRNWGYGDATAPYDHAVVLDLSRMNRILEIDERAGFAVIEPGVTPGQLHAELTKRGGGTWMDANGAGPDTSLVGNFLERGFGHTPLGERANQFSGMEVVLGTGETLRTGFLHYAGARAAHVYRHGVGPSLDGLFFQSNYGVVTRLGIWLMPKPEAFDGFHCAVGEDGDLVALVDRLSALRRSGVVRSCVHILNPLRALVKSVPYPWDETGGRRPVSAATLRAWREKFQVGAWNATGGFYGPREIVDASLTVAQRTFAPFKITALSDPSTVAATARNSARRFLQGIPAEAALGTASWRNRDAPTEASPVHGAGLVWLVPTLPATGTDAMRVADLLRTSLEPHGFDIPITFTLINERAMTCTSNISFNRRDPEDCKAAGVAYRQTMARLISEGYPPYRSGIGGYDLLGDGSSFWKVAKQIKATLDPDGIISPGRYEA